MPRTKRAAQYGAQSGRSHLDAVATGPIPIDSSVSAAVQPSVVQITVRKRGRPATRSAVSQKPSVSSVAEGTTNKRSRPNIVDSSDPRVPLVSPEIPDESVRPPWACDVIRRLARDNFERDNALACEQKEEAFAREKKERDDEILLLKARLDEALAGPVGPTGVAAFKHHETPLGSHTEFAGIKSFSVGDRLIKTLPKFKGGDDENFNSWVLNTRSGLKRSTCSENEKIDIVLMKIEGYPREILDNIGEFESVECIFDALKSTYGRDQRSILSSIRQFPDESVRVYSTRLKMNLKLLGIRSDDESSLVRLDYFVKGLIPAIASRVKVLLPSSLTLAEEYALQIEADNLSVQEGRKNKKSVDTLNHMHEPSATANRLNTPSLEESMKTVFKKLDDFDHAHKSIQEKVNSMFSRPNTSTQAFGKYNFDNGHSSSARSSNANRGKSSRDDRPYLGYCFGCKKAGHRYDECRTTSKADIAYIREHFREYLDEYYKQKRNA